MAAATNIQKVVVSFASPEALGTWLSNLAADATAGKVVGFQLVAEPDSGKISGSIAIPTPTDLTAALEDPPA